MDIVELVAPAAAQEEKPYVCEDPEFGCKKAFARRSDLIRHERIHRNERPFPCDFRACNKRFIQRSALTVHMRTHTGERPHSCEICSRAFSDSSSLARHRRVHTGKRPYRCTFPDCDKTRFCRKTTLSKHIKNHIGHDPVEAARLVNESIARNALEQQQEEERLAAAASLAAKLRDDDDDDPGSPVAAAKKSKKKAPRKTTAKKGKANAAAPPIATPESLNSGEGFDDRLSIAASRKSSDVGAIIDPTLGAGLLGPASATLAYPTPVLANGEISYHDASHHHHHHIPAPTTTTPLAGAFPHHHHPHAEAGGYRTTSAPPMPSHAHVEGVWTRTTAGETPSSHGGSDEDAAVATYRSPPPTQPLGGAGGFHPVESSEAMHQHGPYAFAIPKPYAPKAVPTYPPYFAHPVSTFDHAALKAYIPPAHPHPHSAGPLQTHFPSPYVASPQMLDPRYGAYFGGGGHQGTPIASPSPMVGHRGAAGGHGGAAAATGLGITGLGITGLAMSPSSSLESSASSSIGGVGHPHPHPHQQQHVREEYAPAGPWAGAGHVVHAGAPAPRWQQ